MRRIWGLGLFLAPKIDFFHSFFEVPIFNRFWSVLGGSGEGLGRVWEGFGEGFWRVWDGFGDEILQPLANQTRDGRRIALCAPPPTVGGAGRARSGKVKFLPILLSSRSFL